MRRFNCICGGEIFLENRVCVHCQRLVAYSPERGTMVALQILSDDHWQLPGSGELVKPCGYRKQYNVCNAVLNAADNHELCLSCRLNRTIPDLSKKDNLTHWNKLEEAKRRLLFGLLTLGLPLEAPVGGYPRGLCFDFLEDKRSNPDVADEFIATGHQNGVITINVIEADDVQRIWQREQSSERYRTLLGHMRHEVGHYYDELLVNDLTAFTALFGDPRQPYSAALQQYHAEGPLPGWELSHISAYASSHPSEDWAECFAHYLHIIDTLETAVQRGVIDTFDSNDINSLINVWDSFSVTLNELNRSIGLADAYPFVVTPAVADKLRFVHQARMQAYAKPNLSTG
ncbi:MAG: hypothetical protein CL866_00720 [Cycloclasticus sp.]|nr:hypothetical protein [Cycloclasticus sp.]MBG95381.1 hypothetical protein [Cycloclasticus sp.]HAI97210.1 hypothetical protein [Methylococcaceae bacterium]